MCLVLVGRCGWVLDERLLFGVLMRTSSRILAVSGIRMAKEEG